MERNTVQSSHQERNSAELPAILGGTPVFEQTPDVLIRSWTVEPNHGGGSADCL